MATKINPVTGALDYYEQALPPFRNKIYNGEMRIDQRNNGSSVTPASGEFTVDRWVYEATQSSKAAFQQVSTAPTGFINSAKLTSNSAYTVAAGDVFQIVQRIEGSNISELAWGTATASNVTLSFKAYSSLTGTFGGFLRNSANDRYYIFTYSIPVANTWTDISITIPGDTTGTWLTTNGYGLGVGWSLGSGSNYQTTAGSWGSGNKRGATGQVDLVATNGATFYITGAQLEIGASATPFEHRPVVTELSLCKRYFENLGLTYTGHWGGLKGSNRATTIYYEVEKRATPTVSDATSRNADSGATATVSAAGITTRKFHYSTNETEGSTGHSVHIYATNGINVNAEL